MQYNPNTTRCPNTRRSPTDIYHHLQKYYKHISYSAPTNKIPNKKNRIRYTHIYTLTLNKSAGIDFVCTFSKRYAISHTFLTLPDSSRYSR